MRVFSALSHIQSPVSFATRRYAPAPRSDVAFESRRFENTPRLHNLVVCTLCSCYPRSLLGEPPAWYVSKAYRSRAVREPRKVLEEFGVTLADGTQVRVHDSNADLRYIVVPMRPAGTESLSEQKLADLVTRDCLVGTALPRAPTS